MKKKKTFLLNECHRQYLPQITIWGDRGLHQCPGHDLPNFTEQIVSSVKGFAYWKKSKVRTAKKESLSQMLLVSRCNSEYVHVAELLCHAYYLQVIVLTCVSEN